MDTSAEILAEELKLRIWEKAQVDVSVDASGAVFRRDMRGNLICLSSYGDRTSVLGWEIDHRVPLSQGGTDEESNLRPLQWEEIVAACDLSPLERLFVPGVPCRMTAV